VAGARARLAFAERDARRFGNLALTGAGTVQQERLCRALGGGWEITE
jgi:membrane fusion protein (multidrug efflux system)